MSHHKFGSGVLPSFLKSVFRHPSGAITVSVDSTDHDLDLLTAIAAATAADESVAPNLIRLAEIHERLTQAEREGVHFSERRALEDEKTDVVAEIDAAMDLVNLGDGCSGFVRSAVARELAVVLDAFSKGAAA